MGGLANAGGEEDNTVGLHDQKEAANSRLMNYVDKEAHVGEIAY